MSENTALQCFFESLNTLRHRVHMHFKTKRPLDDLYPAIDAEFKRLANALEKEKGSPKSYHLLKVDFSSIDKGWITVAAKDGFTMRLWVMKKADFRRWTELPGSDKYHRPNTFTRNKKG